MTTITKNCLNCNIQFQALLKEHNRGFGKYCSKSCCWKYKKNKPIKIKVPNTKCSVCSIPIYRTKFRLKNIKHGHHFCSRKCKELAQSPTSQHYIEDIAPKHYKNRKQ